MDAANTLTQSGQGALSFAPRGAIFHDHEARHNYFPFRLNDIRKLPLRIRFPSCIMGSGTELSRDDFELPSLQ